jgi:peptidoglycan-associated lipoprotein
VHRAGLEAQLIDSQRQEEFHMNTLIQQRSLRMFAALALPLAVMAACSEEGATTQSDIYPAKSIEMIDPAPGVVSEVDGPILAATISIPDSTSSSGAVMPVSDVENATAGPESTPIQQSGVLLFDTDKDSVSAQDMNILQQYAAFLTSHPDSALVISGHADERGTREHNSDLSGRRAQQVVSVLVSMGVSEAQLQTRSFGEDQPVNDPKNWAENRRVELNYLNSNLVSSR